MHECVGDDVGVDIARGVRRRHALAVEQNQGAGQSQVAQVQNVHAGHAGADAAGVHPGAARERRQFVELVGQVDGRGPLEVLDAEDRGRGRRLVAVTNDARAGDDHFADAVPGGGRRLGDVGRCLLGPRRRRRSQGGHGAQAQNTGSIEQTQCPTHRTATLHLIPQSKITAASHGGGSRTAPLFGLNWKTTRCSVQSDSC